MTPALRLACLLLLATLPPVGAAQSFDPVHTRFGFELRTRWGQRVEGVFPRYGGEVTHLPDGRQQVHITLATGAIEVAGSRRYTAMARGSRFFHAARYPVIEFSSEPHSPALVHAGGELRGKLRLHGVGRLETFQLQPATCARPGLDCDVIATGSVDRADYGLDNLQLALSNRVRFTMRLRLNQAGK